jgi:hypothetical protein
MGLGDVRIAEQHANGGRHRADRSFAALAPLELAFDDAGAILQAVDAYTAGCTLGEDDLPHVAAALAAGISDRGRHFERGLDWLLAGIAADLESRLH